MHGLEEVAVLRGGSTVPEHDTAEVVDTGTDGLLDVVGHLRGGDVSGASAFLAAGGADVQFRGGADLAGPLLEGVNEAWLVDVAVAVVVELHEDEVHCLHGVERDGGVRDWALGCRRDIFAGLCGFGQRAEGRDEGGVVLWLLVLVVNVEAVDHSAAEWSHLRALARAFAEQVPDFGGQVLGLVVAGEGAVAGGSTQTEHHLLTARLASCDVLAQIRTAQETGGASSLLRRVWSTRARGPEVQARVALGAFGEAVEEGEDDDIDIRVGTQL